MSNIPTSERAAVHRVPPEVLSKIFVECLPTDSAAQDTQQVLSSICQFWRAVALATPALWASLDITCNNDILRPPLPVIHAYLQRSQIHPLSFILRADKKRAPGANPNILPVLTALATARTRWRNVDIKLIRMKQDILDLIMLGEAPLLESIQCDVEKRSKKLPIPLRMLDHCPRLESFQWCGYRAPLLLPLVDTPLTSVSLDTILTVLGCITLLRLSPRLSSAKFSSIYDLKPPPPPTSHLIHSTLRTFTAVGAYCTTLLDALTLPSLVDLDLTFDEIIDPVPTDWEIALPAFLERSNPTLHQLSLSNMCHTGDGEPALVRIMTLAPHLRSLTLSEGPDDSIPFIDMPIRALHPPPPPGIPLCPHLQRLRLSRVEKCPNGVCAAMLRARWGAQAHANKVASLEWAEIELIDGAHDRDKVAMKELYAEGMQGEIVYHVYRDIV